MAAVVPIVVSAPGSLMLLGEHAVLHGFRALVAAIDQRITVRLFPSTTRSLRIRSALGNYDAPLDALPDDPSFRFVLQAVRQHMVRLPSGCDVEIDSEFSAEIGFGSSAAVTVAMHAALMRWVDGVPPSLTVLFDAALATVHAVQGRGSGADIAASVFGGAVVYCTKPTFKPIAISLPLTAVYCGYKTTTPEVIRQVEARRCANPQQYDEVFSAMDACVGAAVECLKNDDVEGFGRVINQGQRCMEALGVNTPELVEIVAALQSDPAICGAKISGSGMGDCAVGIGIATHPPQGYRFYRVAITACGVLFEANPCHS